MFDTTGPGIPYRNKRDFTRSHAMRGLTRSRAAGPSMNNMFMPTFGANNWPGNFMSGGNATPYSRIEELPDYASTPLAAAFGGMYGSPFTRDAKLGAEYALDPVSFGRAAHKLNETLRSASTACRDLDKRFKEELSGSSLALWAPQQLLDALWAARLEWDGAKPKARENTSEQRSAADAVVYGTIACRVLAALQDVKAAGYPPAEYMEAAGPKVSPEMCRHVMNKLRATLKSVSELVVSVKNDRRLMGLLPYSTAPLLPSEPPDIPDAGGRICAIASIDRD